MKRFLSGHILHFFHFKRATIVQDLAHDLRLIRRSQPFRFYEFFLRVFILLSVPVSNTFDHGLARRYARCGQRRREAFIEEG